MKVNELLYRRVDIADAVSAHLLALERAAGIGFGRYIVSATTPFSAADLVELRTDAAAVVARHVSGLRGRVRRARVEDVPAIERVYVNAKARDELGWLPLYDFGFALERLRAGEEPRSALAEAVGSKGYGVSSSSTASGRR